ncbi:hypothetical protein DJ568_05235 [Mucilaginibacter hurinus]|uniref:Uncharacterized protein n=2 Tax=Mucilaginibacter hurinus TaxID=2201324 RepID=A0A367GSM0_9SPHI|nr:hypothetical protein DJ568_05235 [Mucilaginibacter hurinus]
MQKKELDANAELIYTKPDWAWFDEPLKGKVAEAFIYRRNADDFFPKLCLLYFFDENDKKMIGVEYNWGTRNFNYDIPEKKLKELTRKETEFTAKYDTLKTQLGSLLGEPIRSGTVINTAYAIITQSYWEDPEKVVRLVLAFNRKLWDLPFGSKSDTELLVQIYYKN